MEAEAVQLDLTSLRDGDILLAEDGLRHRVQRNSPALRVIRLQNTRTGADDYDYDEVESWNLTRQERDVGGKSATRLADLRDDCERLGVPTDGLVSISDFQTALGNFLNKGKDTLEQIAPQLAADGKKDQDFSSPKPWDSLALRQKFWNNGSWVAEEKLDGVRLKLHFTPTGVRCDSRGISKKTRQYDEKSKNFPHLQGLKVPELTGTVLDCEALIPGVKTGVLPSGVRFYGELSLATSTANAGPDTSLRIQRKFGPMQFWAFDILYHKGENVMGLPFQRRREILITVMDSLAANYAITTRFLHLIRQERADKMLFYEEMLAKGGEGIILKDVRAAYMPGKRAKSWTKLKKFLEVDTFVIGYEPGREGNTGLVGALKLGVNFPGLGEHWIATPSAMAGEIRNAMSAPDGSLKPEYYGRTVAVRGQEIQKNGRFRHAVFVDTVNLFRTDKTKEECDGHEVADDLKACGIFRR